MCPQSIVNLSQKICTFACAYTELWSWTWTEFNASGSMLAKQCSQWNPARNAKINVQANPSSYTDRYLKNRCCTGVNTEIYLSWKEVAWKTPPSLHCFPLFVIVAGVSKGFLNHLRLISLAGWNSLKAHTHAHTHIYMSLSLFCFYGATRKATEKKNVE